jgi:DNA-directed RNA polymerase subunit omega
VAQEGFDKLMELTDSRYRLSMIAARRAAQLKNGIPTLLEGSEHPKTRNTVTLALKELVLDKPIEWGSDLPTNEELRQVVERDRRLDASTYSVSYRREAAPALPDLGDEDDDE